MKSHNYHSHCEESRRSLSGRRSNHGFEIASRLLRLRLAVARNDGIPGLAMTLGRRGQVSMEYAIIFAVVLAAIFATGIIDKTRNSFKAYFTKASGSMTQMHSGAQAPSSGREGAGGGQVAAGIEIPGAQGTQEDPQAGSGGSVEER